MFANLMKSSLVAVMGLGFLGSVSTKAEAHGYVRRGYATRPAPIVVRGHRDYNRPVVVVDRPRYYTTPVYYNRPVAYSRPIVVTEPFVYSEPVIYREPTVVISQPSCSRPVVYTEPVYYRSPRDNFGLEFNFGRVGRHSYYNAGFGFDWR